ncbi:MAG: hypothetical protein H7339_17045 [Arcicella sp.]|nr:hypothetical protein [Arcicella sp.]
MKYTLIFLVFLGCSSNVKDTFNSVELTSSKGEKLYVNSLNWGVTDDHQITAISSRKDRVRERTDTLGVAKGLEPFLYSFNNDTLRLFFNNSKTYEIKEKFKTITVKYLVLNAKNYKNLRQKAYDNNGYYAIPKRENVDYPADMPIGQKK